MRLVIELGGTQTDTHCSMASTINACGKLDTMRDKCRMFGVKLEWDFDKHAYKRCQKCIEIEEK